MLSRLMMRTSHRCLNTNVPVRFYRPQTGAMNPYKFNPTPLSEAEKESQKDLPVWDRVFDH